MYITAQLVISGALDEDVSFDTEDEFDSWLNEIKATEADASSAAGQPWDVFRIVPDHPLGDCMCVQYLTDHSPYWSNSHEW